MTFAGGENKLRDEAESFKRNNKPGWAMLKARRRRWRKPCDAERSLEAKKIGRRQTARQRYSLRRTAEWLAASMAKDAERRSSELAPYQMLGEAD